MFFHHGRQSLSCQIQLEFKYKYNLIILTSEMTTLANRTYFLTTNLILLLPRTILSSRGIPNQVGLRKGIPSGKPST